MQRPNSLILALSLLAPALFGQENTKNGSKSNPWEVGVGTDPVPGRIPGTVRFNVTFSKRGFNLDEFRAAIENSQPPEVVAAIVRDLELRARQDQEAFRKAIEALGGGMHLQFWLINACTIEIPAAKVAQVRAMANVLSVMPDLPTYPLTLTAVPFIKVSTDSSHHNADAEQLAGNKATGFGLAIVDTSQNDNAHGVNLPHMGYYRNADRTNHSGGGIDGSRLRANIAKGLQPANNNHPHGTGVAGIAAGAGWLTAGADAGHSSDAWIVGYSICDTAGSCNSSFATEAAGWQQVAADKATYNIVAGNMSYGSSPNPTDVSQQAIDACAINADVLPVTAAGNSGSAGTGGSSSTANGLAAAAIDATNKTVASFSTRGPIEAGRTFPDIAACGVNTVMPQYGNETTDYIASGTSMASPQVTGAAGLVKSARPALNAREMKALLLNNTESIQTQNPGLGRNDFGVGFLRDDIACSAARAGNVLSSTINSTVTPTTHSMAVTMNQIYAVTLVFHRHVLTSTTWSNLDLRIKNGATVLASSTSTRNLYEKVEFSAPLTGNVTIEVSALSLEVASVPYSVAFGLSSSNGLAAVQRSGTGCIAGAVSFYELFQPGGFDLANRNIQMVPAGGGYAVLPGNAAFIAPTSVGLALGDDQLAAPRTLPFSFAFPGGSTTQIRICSNGFIYLNATGSSNSYVPAVVDALSGGPRLFPMWMDLLPDGGTNVNNVFYDVDAGNTRVRITWRNVPEYGAGGSNTFQVALNANGNVDWIIQATSHSSGAGHQCFVGFSPGAGNRDPGGRDLSTSIPFSTQPDAVPLTQDATRPLLGGTCNLLVSSIAPGSVAGLVLIGPSVPGGLDLTGAGMPGCFLYVNPIAVALAFSTAGSSATIPVPIPNDPSLSGAPVPTQSVTITPGLNALGAATSNLATLILGQF